MAKLVTPKYMKIFDIQKLLKYIFNNDKRPHYVQLIPKPQNVAVILLKNAPNISKLENLGFLSVHVNENVKKEDILNNILKSVDINTVKLSLITQENLKLIEKHDIVHMFSYTCFIKSKTNFDKSIFDSYIKPNKISKYFIIAIDCEMMSCEDRKQVGRVSMLDHNGIIIYDKFIKPESTVIDYLEKYSGLNKENTGKGISIKQLHEDLLSIIGTNTYLLGHGLENDLESINFYTENVIDTSYLFLNTDGYKLKLSQLAKKHFGDLIQSKEHCPIEDALCCLKLLAYKIAQIKNFYDINGRSIKLNATVKAIERLEESELKVKNNTLLLCKEDSIDYESLKQRKDMFSIFIYEIEGNIFIAFNPTNKY